MMEFGFGGLGLMALVIFWLVIIALALWAVSRLFPRASGSSGAGPQPPNDAAQPSAEEILRQRFARGEINKDQFEDMRRTLSAHR